MVTKRHNYERHYFELKDITGQLYYSTPKCMLILSLNRTIQEKTAPQEEHLAQIF